MPRHSHGDAHWHILSYFDWDKLPQFFVLDGSKQRTWRLGSGQWFGTNILEYCHVPSKLKNGWFKWLWVND